MDPEYAAALAAHLREESEASLSRAYDLGRSALARGLGILELFAIYQAIQEELVLAAAPAEQPRVAAAIGNFFRELLSSYEMSFRGYRDANLELKRLNDDLKSAYAELQLKQLQLVQSAKMASLGELVAGIAHEINNPLAFILSHLATASSSLNKAAAELEPQPSPRMLEHFQRARARLAESVAGAERIQELVLKLRTFSRLDEGERKQVSISESVGSVLKILEHRCWDRITVKTHFGHPDLVVCFPSLLNQAIMNLVSNAIDAIEGAGEISILTGADGPDYVIIVSDNGPGIPEELRARVLEPFFTTKPVGVGTGLGLSITYSIVQKHHGSLELTPRTGGGNNATIRFPMAASLPAPGP